MAKGISFSYTSFDMTLFSAMVCILLSGLLTMSSFEWGDAYFWKQGMWIGVCLGVFLFLSQFEYRFLKQTRVVMWIYVLLLSVLSLLFILGHAAKGAESWFKLGGVAFQPIDLMKLGLIFSQILVLRWSSFLYGSDLFLFQEYRYGMLFWCFSLEQ